MNDVAKEAIKSRLVVAMESEQLTNGIAASWLGIRHEYIGFVKAGKFDKVSKSAWDVLQKWTNSGESIKGYSKVEVVSVSKSPTPESKAPDNLTTELIRLLKEHRAKLAEELTAINTVLKIYDPQS